MSVARILNWARSTLPADIRTLAAGPIAAFGLCLQMLAAMFVRTGKTAAALLVALVLMQVSAANAQSLANLCTTQGGSLGTNTLVNNGSFGTGSNTAGTNGSALPAGTTDYTFTNYGANSPQDGQ